MSPAYIPILFWKEKKEKKIPGNRQKGSWSSWVVLDLLGCTKSSHHFKKHTHKNPQNNRTVMKFFL